MYRKIIQIMIGTCLVYFFIALFLSNTSNALVYYVSETGSDSNSGSEINPWRTIQHAADGVSAGDTVIVKNGIYRPFIIRKAGVSENWITFKSENLYGAVIDGGVTSQKDHVDGISIYRTEFIRLEGFEIINCLIGVAVRGVSMSDPSHDILGLRLKIHHIGRNYIDQDCDDGGDSPWAGIYTQTGTRRTTWDSCEVFDIGRLKNGCCYSGTFPACDFFYDHNFYLAGDEQTVQNCLIYSAHSGFLIKLTSSEYSSTSKFSHKIINNTFAHAANKNFLTPKPFCDPRNPVGHIEITGGQGSKEIFGVIIRNNIFYNPPGGVVIWQGSQDLSAIKYFDHNITSAETWVYQYGGTGSLNASECIKGISLSDFGLKDAADNDFKPTKESRYLIDKGNNESTPDYDFERKGRVQGGSVDIGAYESAPPIGKPSGLRMSKP